MNEMTMIMPATSGLEDGLIGNQEFCELIRSPSRPLLQLAAGLAAMRADEIVLTRPLIGRLLLESRQMEALLDEYGARQNRQWRRFRALIATLKNMARIGELLAYIQRRLPAYRLLPVSRDFAAATGERLRLLSGVVAEVAAGLVEEAQRVGLDISGIMPALADFGERLPPGRLAHTCADRLAGDAAGTVTHLATEFLNLAAEPDLLSAVTQVSPEEYAARFPDPVSEERLRQLSFRFHSLQSLYDTHVAATSIESSDPDLSILRSHATVIYHLLDLATDLAHYYERHISPQTGDPVLREWPVVDSEVTMATLFGYALTFASDYLTGGQSICRGILRRYAESGRLDVPVPTYRGFHVRPSNLVARIVAHYGSAVQMDLDGALFDAASPFDLFRANETINARKRRWLASEIARVLSASGQSTDAASVADSVLTIIQRLAAAGKVMLYRQPLQLSAEIGRREGGVLENAVAEMAHLQATGQLDISTDLTVTFIGDKRVLADIDTLAHHGYGEDAVGNNVALPKALAYLRR